MWDAAIFFIKIDLILLSYFLKSLMTPMCIWKGSQKVPVPFFTIFIAPVE
jgi:hypothetical protein